MAQILKITVGKADALNSLCPNKRFRIENDIVEWLDENLNPPTEEEIQAEVVRLQQYYDNKEYQFKRAAEYPSYADQFDTLYHGGYDAWKAQIQAVKDKYPKPE